MARRASAFVQDLDELDALAELPLSSPQSPDPSDTEHGRDRGSSPVEQGLAPPSNVALPTHPAEAADPLTHTEKVLPQTSPTSAGFKLVDGAIEPATPDAASTGDQQPQPAPLRTQVRLAPELAAWITLVATREEITTGSVITVAALDPAAPAEPDGGGRDDLVRVRRTSSSGSNSAVPVTVSFTGAQRQVIDGLAARWNCTRTAVVATVVRAAMASVTTQHPAAAQPQGKRDVT
jgi:hypothetical protein